MTSQALQLSGNWPQTFAALARTYYDGQDWTRTKPDGSNDAGYALAGLGRVELHCGDLHGHRQITRGAIDHAAAREVYYHWSRGTKFRRPIAALASCWNRLVTERPEKIFAAMAKERKHAI